MFRSMSRTAAVAVVVLTLFAFVPAAQASSFDFSAPSPDVHAGWFDMALSWLSSLMFGEETSSPQATFETTDTPIVYGGAYTPLGGMCIDPEGRPRPGCAL